MFSYWIDAHTSEGLIIGFNQQKNSPKGAGQEEKVG
jgi:hypothetical protein